MFTRSITGKAILGAAVLAATIGLASVPANATTHASFGALVPASPIYVIDSITVTGKCGIADAPARITHAYRLEWPQVAQEQGVASAAAQVRLDLDSRGTLVQESIASSSGNPLLDDAALLAVRMSKFAPEVQACTQYARSYNLNVMFE